MTFIEFILLTPFAVLLAIIVAAMLGVLDDMER